jgi:hypothetical protein
VFGIPTLGVIKDFTVNIGLYAPASLAVAGLAAGPWAAPGSPTLAGARGGALAALVIGVAAVGAVRDAGNLIPQTELAKADDLAAFAWIRDAVPDGAVFLTSSFAAFGDTVVAGDDAGWWLPYFTGRKTTLPPITVGTERGRDAGYRERLVALSAAWHTDVDAAATVARLDAAGVTHAFVGSVAVANDAAGTGQGLGPRLEASPQWEVAHRSGDATVYRRLGRAP